MFTWNAFKWLFFSIVLKKKNSTFHGICPHLCFNHNSLVFQRFIYISAFSVNVTLEKKYTHSHNLLTQRLLAQWMEEAQEICQKWFGNVVSLNAVCKIHFNSWCLIASQHFFKVPSGTVSVVGNLCWKGNLGGVKYIASWGSWTKLFRQRYFWLINIWRTWLYICISCPGGLLFQGRPSVQHLCSGW